MTDNRIGDEGVKVLSEMLKVNNTLAILYLSGETRKKMKRERNREQRVNCRMQNEERRSKSNERNAENEHHINITGSRT